ncbi:Hypothetical predicted protein [Paramuricea clavata]|uniref:Uncharacterized protein n=1 Tax=Paramuricea clavata TaxID=317549 RepID=A0A6S7FFY1_PARCT|nr:Hypothetical predicted protein [Paramuricea clavata]
MDTLKEKLGKSTLIILDDLMIIAGNDSVNLTNLNNIASRDSHHSNASVIFVCQSLNYGSGKLRTIKVNSQYHIMCKSLSCYRDVETVAANKKICKNKIHQVINDVGKKEYGYIVFDGCPKGCANTRVRTGIFPKDETIVYDV